MAVNPTWETTKGVLRPTVVQEAQSKQPQTSDISPWAGGEKLRIAALLVSGGSRWQLHEPSIFFLTERCVGCDLRRSQSQSQSVGSTLVFVHKGRMPVLCARTHLRQPDNLRKDLRGQHGHHLPRRKEAEAPRGRPRRAEAAELGAEAISSSVHPPHPGLTLGETLEVAWRLRSFSLSASSPPPS